MWDVMCLRTSRPVHQKMGVVSPVPGCHLNSAKSYMYRGHGDVWQRGWVAVKATRAVLTIRQMRSHGAGCASGVDLIAPVDEQPPDLGLALSFHFGSGVDPRGQLLSKRFCVGVGGADIHRPLLAGQNDLLRL